MGNQEWTIKNGQSRMDNPEKPATLGTQDTGRRQTKHNTENKKVHRCLKKVDIGRELMSL